jgi:hypothetical protein
MIEDDEKGAMTKNRENSIRDIKLIGHTCLDCPLPNCQRPNHAKAAGASRLELWQMRKIQRVKAKNQKCQIASQYHHS